MKNQPPSAVSLPSIRAIGFFGDAPRCDPAAIEAGLRRELASLHPSPHRALALAPLTGVAESIFARLALEAGIPLVLLLLVPREELAATFPEDRRAEIGTVLDRATAIEVVRPVLSEISSALHLSQRLVDQAGILLVLQASDAPSEEIVSYATRRGREVITLTATAGEIASRRHPALPPGRAEEIESLCRALGPPPPEPVIPSEVAAYFAAIDAEATRTAPQVRRYALNIVLANALASMAGSVSSSFPHEDSVGTDLTVIKFGAILLGLGIFAALRRHQTQNRWLSHRLRAEICRSMMATWSSPKVVEPVSADELPELGDVIRALHFLRVTQPRQPSFSLEQFKAHYGLRRLADQYRYFQRNAEAATRAGRWLSPLYWTFSLAALVTSGAALAADRYLHLGTWGNFFFVFVPIVAPILASWVIAWQAIESVSRKKIRLGEMQRLMHQALVDLVHCHTWDGVLHIVKRAEKVLLNEVLEWYSFVKLK